MSALPDACTRYADWICAELPEDGAACATASVVALMMSPAACEFALADQERSRSLLATFKTTCTRIIDRACAELGPGSEGCREVREQLANAPASNCQVMERRYASMIAELRQKEAARLPLSPDLVSRLRAPDAPSFGAPDATLSIILFSDFECPYCARAALTTAAIYKRFGSRVHFVFRQLTLPIHAHADLAAQASLEAHAQGLFWPFHDAAFSHQDQLDREGLVMRATEIGLNIEAFKAALDSGAHAAELASDMALAKEAGADATPTMFLNGKRLPDATDAAAVLAAIDAALAPTTSEAATK